mmetsp:Transcript_21811/g.70226  ORF Transcript_21811/g.70226 Transcript_21811/m.70226 type:complete len:402 (+) Transcript_21811:141-1346(+)
MRAWWSFVAASVSARQTVTLEETICCVAMWGPEAVLVAESAMHVIGADGETSQVLEMRGGRAVAMSDGVIVVGLDASAVVFRRRTSEYRNQSWSVDHEIVETPASAVAVDGTTALVGGAKGAVLFRHRAWAAPLVRDAPVLAVAIHDGTAAVVVAPSDDDDDGYVSLFREATAWRLQERLPALPRRREVDVSSAALSGGRLLLGGPNGALLYEEEEEEGGGNKPSWRELPSAGAVALDGDTMVVGSTVFDNNNNATLVLPSSSGKGLADCDWGPTAVAASKGVVVAACQTTASWVDLLQEQERRLLSVTPAPTFETAAPNGELGRATFPPTFETPPPHAAAERTVDTPTPVPTKDTPVPSFVSPSPSSPPTPAPALVTRNLDPPTTNFPSFVSPAPTPPPA